jgi:DNA-binding MarR family transcriptional regulator
VVNDLAVDVVTLANRLRPVLFKTGGQVALLVAIKTKPGIGVNELAGQERMSAPGMSKYIGRLEAAGLVERSPGADRRRVGLRLSANGERVLRSVKARRTAWLAAHLRELEPEEVAAIDRAIDGLGRLLEVEP